MEELTKQGIAYIKERKEYQRIMDGILNNYRRLGKLSGTITLAQLSDGEKEVLSSLNYQVYQQPSCRFSVKKFVDAFCVGRFTELDFIEVVNGYYGKALQTKEEEKDLREQAEKEFWERVLEQIQWHVLRNWLQAVIVDKERQSQLLRQRYNKNQEQLAELLIALDRGGLYLDAHQEQLIPLAILGAKVAKDPHYFDLNCIGGKLLLTLLAYEQEQQYPRTIEEVNDLLNGRHIIRDEVSNSTSCYGLNGQYGETTAPWEWFWGMGQPLQLTLANLDGLSQVKGRNDMVFVVENPSVFLELIKRLRDKPISLICTSGQINSSSWMLLDRLVEQGTCLYYHGDFDPEGLQIADKLKRRYGQKLNLWGYDVGDYKRCVSNVELGKSRLQQLHSIQSSQLQELVEKMRIWGKAGYQELLIEELVESIEKCLNC